MVAVTLLVGVEAKLGREAAVESSLRGASRSSNGEPATTAWFAIYPGKSGRKAHLSGRDAEAKMAKSTEPFAHPATF